MRKRVKNIHFVGVGGSGMSGIAEVLVNLDYRVSGSDIAAGPVTRRLEEAGVTVNIGHDVAHISNADVVVVSSAIDRTNPEVAGALTARIPVIPRAEMLGELMRFQQGIAVAGTHGKTTTTSLVSAILINGGLDPTFVVGGLINSAGVNAKLGQGEYLVAEADESDASFLNLKPEMAVVTNIDEDHMITYEGDLATLKKTFVAFLQNLPFYGLAVLCIDDANVRSILKDVHKPVMTYGLREDAEIYAYDLKQTGTRMQFKVRRPNTKKDIALDLALPGRHNVQNALAAIAIATHLGVDDASIIQGLAEFGGIGRRFQILGDAIFEGKRVMMVDDYAHHPVEISATLDAARGSWPDRRIVAVFQPHRYSRTSDLFEDFIQSLADQQALVISEVYPAGEQAIAGATGKALCQAIRVRGASQPVYLAEIEDLGSVLAPYVLEGDIVLCMGAGSIGKAVKDVYAAYQVSAGLPGQTQQKGDA
ncbi:MAG: UDP-N-acetylmuramate--L-alanine ligase [Arenicella sp.]|jgi:UDP-N-acetylmuramate--alanine ligase|nr:UDP-N-acetylmuramate--L-alanine ligase [Arenicella sp.]